MSSQSRSSDFDFKSAKKKGRVNLKARNEPLQFQFLWHKGYFFVWTWGAFASKPFT